ncbi:cyanophycin synthetase [Azohydromonas lata]|uniref:Cyanophycin synthetase n=1 Tax=Azohydromonas lata TaxID=45677 RepID=A0ABU5IIU3_9BURK|nr:cyanophycin synthetase [Azohydromonas lata]MDZ5458700.1 cyanophycin synthetase [Azohydromonas lata]
MSPKNDIRLLRINHLRGPNIWTYRPALEVWLDLGELEDFPSNLLPGFTDRLLGLLPNLMEHHCGVGERGGFVERLREGTWAGHILEHVVIELLNLAGMPTGFGQTRSTSQHGVYRMVFRARDEQVARAALAQGHALLMAAINERPFDVGAAVNVVREELDDCYLGPSTAAIVEAATDRRIPHIRLNSGNLVQLGYGARSRRIWTAETDRTSAIGEGIAGDKDLTKTLLAACGVPVPEGQVVESPAEAWEAAQDIGIPVVVKPSDANHGRGVSLELTAQADIEAAFGIADAEGSEVIVERYVRGNEHRLLVVGGKLVAAARGESLWITGDGQGTVTQLIDSQLNSDPRRGEAEDLPLETIRLEREPVMCQLLQRQGLDAGSVPAAGRRVLIQRNGNMAFDCTHEVHPEVAAMAVLAAKVVGLDIAGIDMVAEDISKPLDGQRGAIVEVNAGPGLLMHLKPAVGTPQPVGRAIVDHLFAEGESGRIPIVGVAGTRQTHVTARLIAWLLHLRGLPVGLACRDGLFLENRPVQGGNRADWASGHRLLMNRRIEAAVVENGPLSILRDGLPYDRCNIGIVTDLEGAETLAEHDIRDADQLPKVLRTQVDVVLDEGVAVLNAGDERIAALASLCDGDTILYALDAANPALDAHVAAGGRAVRLNGGSAELLAPDTTPQRLELGAWGTPQRAEGVLPAVSAAWALGIAPALIRAGIETFAAELARNQNPTH